MYYLMFHTFPAATHSERESVGGAFVGCWIVRQTLVEADSVARSIISEALWEIDRREEACPISRADYENKIDGLEYYEQALVDKEVVVFYRYPPEDTHGQPPSEIGSR